MFYFIRPDGLPTPFNSIDEFIDSVSIHAVRMGESGLEFKEVLREDFHSKEVPEENGILGLQTFAWFFGDQFIGYEL